MSREQIGQIIAEHVADQLKTAAIVDGRIKVGLNVLPIADAILAAQQDGAWQPIETAPLDQYVLVAHEGAVSEARYNLEDRNWWMACTGPYDFDASSPIYPTHWCPLPAPPTI